MNINIGSSQLPSKTRPVTATERHSWLCFTQTSRMSPQEHSSHPEESGGPSNMQRHTRDLDADWLCKHCSITSPSCTVVSPQQIHPQEVFILARNEQKHFTDATFSSEASNETSYNGLCLLPRGEMSLCSLLALPKIHTQSTWAAASLFEGWSFTILVTLPLLPHAHHGTLGGETIHCKVNLIVEKFPLADIGTS